MTYVYNWEADKKLKAVLHEKLDPFGTITLTETGQGFDIALDTTPKKG